MWQHGRGGLADARDSGAGAAQSFAAGATNLFPAVLVIFTGSQPQSAATKYFPLFATLGTGDMSRVAAERGCLVYCGNLPEDIRAREIEDVFSKYGRIVSVDLKTPARPPAFAFIEFADPR